MKKSNQKLALVAGGLAVAGVAGYMLMQNQTVQPTGFPVRFSNGGRTLADSVTFTVSPYLYSSSSITAIRVHDITRGKWYSWDNGAWDSNGVPIVQPGTGNLSISFTARNNGNTTGTITLKLTVGTTVVKTLPVSNVAAGALASMPEQIMDMPASAINVKLECSP